jgi:dimethylargininase
MVRSEGDPLKAVVMSPPSEAYSGVVDRVAHNLPHASDPELAKAQHHALRLLCEAEGAAVHLAPPLAGHPNSVFTRDSALVVHEGFVRLRMGLESRRGEEPWMADYLGSLGLAEIGQIGVNGSADGAGTLEGGDVILAGDVAFLGRSERSNAEGLRQLWGVLGRLGYEVRVAEIDSRFMHIGGAMSLVGAETVLACRDVFPEGFFRGFEVIEIPGDRDGASGANVICLGEHNVVAHPGDGPEAPEALDRAGVRVQLLDLSEFRKGDGGPTCLILPVDRG